ncbi:hypothetical protein [Pseudoalteromonas luteoviolacea]|uniref:Intracellular septation protein A n=1 Tax=Pseudoalteromonas luteoviolacea H33 TaxID=1365251 RepID=A0A161Y107_9GAMM|nr:hypothetical protein [Pseudoalteromonas luteoviolacea]KZN49458.1 hypothetical protein N476_19430 [Pseudoalteromonas luteoviolacea H33]KZN72609.1 hypothetical protein N477_24750 [Pseudoalteromonas luteoviolacea H33-S]MBQ4876244.1 hypothetical protein [Pseudoalteromonas luteoviolacea]MBQ4906278.1 hypothetical protein [Pseudoalteromonas luteoviolacea]
MKLSYIILLSIAAIAYFYIQLWDDRLVTPQYLVLLFICTLYGRYKKDTNMTHIAGYIFVASSTTFIIFERGLINHVTPEENPLLQGIVIYGTQMAFSLITVCVLIFRVQLSRLISKSPQIQLTNFDGIFHWLFIYCSLIYLLAMLEHIAWTYFNMKSWTLIYDNFEGLIYISWALCCGGLLTMMICSPELKSNSQKRETS